MPFSIEKAEERMSGDQNFETEEFIFPIQLFDDSVRVEEQKISLQEFC